MWKISFGFDLERSFGSIFLKIDRTVVTMKNWSYVVLVSIRPNEGELEITKIREFLENENLTTDFFFEIQ